MTNTTKRILRYSIAIIIWGFIVAAVFIFGGWIIMP